MRRSTSRLLAVTTLLLVFGSAGAASRSGSDAAVYRQFLPVVQRGYIRQPACLPLYGEAEEVLQLHPATDNWGLASADFNDDGWPDIVVWRGRFQTGLAFPIEILLNDRQGGLVLGTNEVFGADVPHPVEPRRLLLADFNGDGRTDMFFADQGMDTDPFPGYQNTLVLSAPGGKMVDATANLPQQWDQTHSAAAADIDGDGDVDLYVGNLGGGYRLPDILLNDGSGHFEIGVGLLPPAQRDLSENWYTASAFADVNSDGFPDLILGQGERPHSHVLINDGTGHFTQLATPLPNPPWAPGRHSLDIVAADITGDGYQDLFVSCTRGSYAGRWVQVLINNGDGTFRDESATRLPQQDNYSPWPAWIDLLDLDGDGHLDLLLAPMGNGGPFFFLNDGQGAFRPLANVFDIGTDNVFTFVDLDRDGDLDIVWSYPGMAYPWCTVGTCPETHFVVRALGCPP